MKEQTTHHVIGLKLDGTFLVTGNTWAGEADVDVGLDLVTEEGELTAEVVTDLKWSRHCD
jgi:hypothetical protein